MANEDVNALGYFFAASPNLPLRQKLALAMMARNKKFPTNLGEGIASIGQEIGDTLAYRAMMDEDKAAMQAAATATVPPIADSAVPPLQPPQVSVVPDDRPNIVPSRPPQARTVAPPVPGTPGTPLPPDQQQTYEPNAITRMPGRPGRGAAVVPDIPPGQPGNTGADTFLPPGPLSTPVMAQGGVPAEVPPAEEARRAIAHAELRRQMGGAPPPPPAAVEQQPPAAVPSRPAVADYGQPSVLAPTPQAIPAAPPPPSQQVRAIPPSGQPEPVAGYVPPRPDRPQGAPTIGPGPREQQLQAFMAANAGNPHMARSQPALELQALAAERERKQKEADKLFEAELSRGNKQSELNITGQMTQQERIDKAARDRMENAALPEKLEQEAAKRRQELVGGGVSPQGPDPYLGTPRSRQRSGVPEMDPMPKGGIPEVHAKEQMKKIEAERTGLESAKPELREALDLMDKIDAHPAKEQSLGTLGGLGRQTASGQGFTKLHEQLIGKNLVAAYQKIKGTGPVGEREGENIAKAQTALSTATTKEDYDDALKTLRSTLRGAVERSERKMKQPVTAYQKTPDDPYAPDLGEKRGGFEYVGGDPADKRNWKRAQ